MKSFHDHWEAKDEIEHFRTMCVGVNSYPVIISHRKDTSPYNINGNTDYYDCKLLLSQESGQMNEVFWIVAIKDEKEISRWNLAYVLDLDWIL